MKTGGPRADLWIGEGRFLKIAQRFSAGNRASWKEPSPAGTEEPFCRPWRDFVRFVASLPALKCWAILGFLLAAGGRRVIGGASRLKTGESENVAHGRRWWDVASWIRGGGKMGREGGGWSVSLRARFFLVGIGACDAPRNARGAARSADPPALHGGSDGWMARMGASWIRRGERMRADVASRFGKLDLAEAAEDAGIKNPRSRSESCRSMTECLGSRVAACRSRRIPWTGLIFSAPVQSVRMPRRTDLSNGRFFDWNRTDFLMSGRGFDFTVFALDFVQRRRYWAGS